MTRTAGINQRESWCAAIDDAVTRAGGRRLTGDPLASVQTWMRRESLDSLVVACPTVGPWKETVERLAVDMPVRIFVRSWDRALWPHATAGFFRMREKLPGFFNALMNGVT